MINWIKEKYQSHFCHKIWIFIITWGLIYLGLWLALDCVGAIAYTWYYNIHFTWLKWLKNLPAIWVITNSAWVSGVVVLGMFLYYWNHKFDNWKPFDKKKQSNFVQRKCLKEFKKVGKENIIHLNKQVGLSKTQLNKHTLLIGATGSGKTTTALSIINQLVYKLKQTVIIIDGKGDIDLINKVKSVDNNAFIWTIGGTNQYNPLASKSHIVLADKIMSLFDFSEPHYQAIAHSYILLLMKTLKKNKIEITLTNILKYFAKENLINLIDSNDENYDYFNTFKNDDIQGLVNRLSVYNEQLKQNVGCKNNLLELTNQHKIILFSLDSLSYPQLASKQYGKTINSRPKRVCKY